MKKALYVLSLAFATLTIHTDCTKENLPTEETSLSPDLPSEERAGTATGQSVEVNFDLDRTDYQIVGDGVWSFNYSGKPAAVAAFSSYFMVSTSGSLNPSQLETAQHQAFLNNRCNFFSGEPLVASTTNFGPTRSITCTPIAPAQYGAGTGWTFATGDISYPEVNLSNIYLSSVSWLGKARKSNGWQYKYSYTMMNDTLSRLENLLVELLLEGEVVASYAPDHTVSSGGNWIYNSTGEYYGNTEAAAALAYAEGRLVNATQGSNAYDNFSGNNGAGGQRAGVDDITFGPITAPGNYTIRISGTLKGNTFAEDQAFSVSKIAVTSGACN